MPRKLRIPYPGVMYHAMNRATISENGASCSTPDSWIGSSSAPYDDTFLSIQQGLLFKYDYNRPVAACHCLAERSTWWCPKPSQAQALLETGREPGRLGRSAPPPGGHPAGR